MSPPNPKHPEPKNSKQQPGKPPLPPCQQTQSQMDQMAAPYVHKLKTVSQEDLGKDCHISSDSTTELLNA